MKTISLTIPGNPVAKGRPRFSIHQGQARTYSPAETVSWENNVRACAYNAKVTPLDGPLQMTCIFYRPWPKSMSKKARLTAMPGTRPDVDNYIKLVLDALNGIAWRDDAQLVDINAAKRFAEAGRTEITIMQQFSQPRVRISDLLGRGL